MKQEDVIKTKFVINFSDDSNVSFARKDIHFIFLPFVIIQQVNAILASPRVRSRVQVQVSLRLKGSGEITNHSSGQQMTDTQHDLSADLNMSQIK